MSAHVDVLVAGIIELAREMQFMANVGIPVKAEYVGRLADKARCLASVAPVGGGVAGTPSSRWAANGEPDPHGDRYACERAALPMGDLTDDELANAVFVHDHTTPGSIAYLTAAKYRIRWLSRRLASAAGATSPSKEAQP